MIILNDEQIKELQLLSSTCKINKLVRQTIINKNNYVLPTKISLKTNNGFINTMPCIVDDMYSCKIVIRNQENSPSLSGNILVYDVKTSKLISILDSKRITSIRTGSVAAITVETLAVKHFKYISLVGLGKTIYAFLDCLLSIYPTRNLVVSLYKYKDHCDRFINNFTKYPSLEFKIIDNIPELFENADIIVSAVTDQPNLFTNNTNIYKKGCLIIPIQTKGFQNCDTIFDKVFVDDDNHVKCFQNYGKFKYQDELTNVLNGNSNGRENNDERILAYNIGLAIHDNIIACHVLKKYLNQISDKQLDKQLDN